MTALTITLGGVDVTLKVEMSSVVMQLAGSQDIGTCEFDIIDTGNTVSASDEMLLSVTEVGSATVLFGGFVRSRRITVIATGRIIHISAVDYNSLLDRSVVVSDNRVAGESDHARLVYLMTTYGSQFSSDYTQIATLNGSMVAQKFVAITLRQAIERVLGQASTKSSYYCDPTGRLVTYDRSVPTAAPFNVRVGTPSGGELAPEDFSVDNDASNLANAIYVVGATAAGSGWFTDVTSIGVYGRRERFFNAPDSDTHAKAAQVGAAVLEDQKNPIPRGIFTTKSPNDGWRIGQSITVNSTQHGLSGVVYRIARVTVHYLSGAGDREYSIELGAPQATLSALLGATHGGGGGFPWHSPGGAGAWLPVVGGGSTGGGVSSGSGCGCPPWDNTVCTPMRESFSRTVGAGGWGISELTGSAWIAYDNGPAASVDGSTAHLTVTGTFVSPVGATQENGPAMPAYPIHLRFKTKIVGPDGGALSVRLGAALPSSAGGTFFVGLEEFVGGGSPLRVNTIIHGAGGLSSGAFTTPLGATDPLGLWLWVEMLMTAGDLSIRVYLDGGAPGAYTVYTLTGGDVVTLPTNLSFAVVTEATAGHTPETADWRIDLIEFLCDTPSSGQLIPNEFVATGDGIRSTFTLQHPYQPGSVRLQVDGHDETVTETDPTTGAVALTFAPIAGEVVTAEYRAA